MKFGKKHELLFDLTFSTTDMVLGRGSLRVFIGEKEIWGDETQRRGITWTWIDLLEQLARSWPYLKYEESAPIEVRDYLTLLEEGRYLLPDYDLAPSLTAIPQSIYIFLRRHNLATGIEGLYLPSLSFLREGRKMWVLSRGARKQMEFVDTIDTLSNLGDALCEHISSGTQDERSAAAISAWRNREPSSDMALVIRLGSASAHSLVPMNDTIAGFFEAQNDDEFGSSLLVAARMSEAVPIESRRRILAFMKELPYTGISALLQAVSTKAEDFVPNYTRRAYDQGYELARNVREQFGISPSDKADAQGILEKLGVAVVTRSFGTDVIDAVGCWGSGHGPAVLVNSDGEHAQAAHGRRATLAHELAHVIFDRHGSLPVAEVLGGNAPLYPEQRASAFAAEFLMPKQAVSDRIRNAPDKVREIERLCNHFDVSRELAAWHISNSVPSYFLDEETHLLLARWRNREYHFTSWTRHF